jgi:uncharacterized membrane protein
MAGMVRSLLALVVGLIATVAGFYLMIFADIARAEWRYPAGPNSMAGIGGMMIGFVVGPICAVIGALLFLKLTKPKNSNSDTTLSLVQEFRSRSNSIWCRSRRARNSYKNSSDAIPLSELSIWMESQCLRGTTSATDLSGWIRRGLSCDL